MEYKAKTTWERGNAPFTVKDYDRTHQINFGGGIQIQGSAAPEFVGKADLVNPEELFTASISSCLMLTFLYLAAMKGLNIKSYTADAVGKLAKNAEGKMAMTEVVIKPTITFADNAQPDSTVLEDLFKKAHDNCFISCSVKTTVRVDI